MADKLSLKDIAPISVTVVISNAEIGLTKEVDICLPTLQEWQDVYMTVDFPSLPKPIQRMVAGKGKEDFVDMNDPEYLRAKDQATELLAMRRATHALIKAGNFVELQALSIEEATDCLIEKADRALLFAIFSALTRLMNGMRGGVDAKKAAFQGVPLHQTSDANRDTTDERPGVVAATA
jgi:hypothetical protein